MTGIDDPYEEPANAELVIDTSTMTAPEAVEAVLSYLVENGWVEPKLS
jgi:sulfate adenylyltransferase